MTLPLNPETLRAAYDYLLSTPPFSTWTLPDSDDVKFIVMRSRTIAGIHKVDAGHHVIGISTGAIGRTHSLIEVMAHEMIHAFQREIVPTLETRGVEHNASFNKLAARVCRIHGFDPKLF